MPLSGNNAKLTKAAVTMTGSSGVLVAADPARAFVIVSNPAANATAAIDPTGGTAALTAGIPLGPGATIEITGKAAQSAMTQIGTNTQVLTVYTGA
jgi:poly-gamma-glutamate capsule biosynthesis protein CapA/YwtB (metallophosphatase superfamily)